MGGGDLNTKKSWHPNTIKNQERVWKAEQAAAEEKKRIQELQREKAEERDRAELNNLIKHSSGASGKTDDNKLHWMYDKPDKKVQQEDYLLGKSIDKNYEQTEKPEQDVIPAVARRVVGSSMLSMSGDSQVDLARKLREDPLLLVKERERAARAALLNNPLQRRRLTELLRKEQDQRKESKSKKKNKKDKKDLDEKLAAKLNALGGEKGIDISTLLASDSSDSSSESKISKKKKKKRKHEKKSKKEKKKKHHSSSDDATDGELPWKYKNRSKKDVKNKYDRSDIRKRKSDELSDSESEAKKPRENSYRYKKDISKRDSRHESSDEPQGRGERKISSKSGSSSRTDHAVSKNRRVQMSESDRAAKLAAMVAAGAERELQRGRRVAEQRRADAAAAPPDPRRALRNEARALPDSLETRIHSNRHYIQRDRRHMDEHFARR